MDVNEFLEHHGVRGMKWGVRKGSLGVADMTTGRGVGTLAAPGTALLSKKQVHKGAQAAEKVAQSMLDRETGVLSPKGELTALNAKYAPTFPMKGKDLERYDKDAAVALTEAARKHVPKGADAVVVVSPSEIMLYVGDKETVTKFKEGVKHSYMGGTVCDILRDKNGLIIDIKLSVSDLQQNDMVEEFLAHYGIRGMKWGIRRSRVQLARERFGPSSRSNGRPPWQSPPTRKPPPSHTTTEKPPPHQKSHDQVVFEQLKHKAKKGGLDSLSNEEIRVLVARAEARKKAQTTFPKKKTKKAKLASFVIDDLLIKSGKKTLQSIADEQMKQLGIKKGLLPKKEDKKKNED